MLAILVVLFLVSPTFIIDEIHISGNELVSTDDIMDMLGIDGTTSLVFFNIYTAGRNILQNFYISDIAFRRELPNTLHVYITERRPIAYVEHLPGVFLLLDDDGFVIEVKDQMTERLPLLTGLGVARFQLGQRIQIPTATAFNAIVHYALLLDHHGLIERIAYVNVSDTNNIRIVVGYMEFNVGGVMGADEKVRTILGMLDALPNADIMRGFVDMRNIDSQYFLEILQ